MVLPSTSTFQPEVLDDESHEATEVEDEIRDQKTSKIDLQARHEIVSKTLAAYVELCSILKNPSRGLNALNVYSNKVAASKLFPPLKSINVYNAALKGFASSGNFPKMLEVIKMIKNAEVDLNVQSYAAILQCLGRCNIDNNYLKEIRIYGKEARWNGFSFDRILNEGIFLNDEREQVLKAMKSYDKKYIPTYVLPNIQYNNSLLNHLNSKEQLKYQEKANKTSNGIFSQSKMQEMINGQKEIEKHGYVIVSMYCVILCYSQLGAY